MRLSSKDKLLKMMRAGGDAQNHAIQKLWRLTDHKNRKVVRRGRGTEEDQKDTRQEATMLLYLAISQEKFRGSTDAELVSFYKQTFRYIWLDKVRKRDHMPMTDLEAYTAGIDNTVEEILIQLELKTKSQQKLANCLSRLDEKGAEMIRWRYFEIPPKSWDEIARSLGYKTTQAAQNKGGKGMKALRICMGN